jgi:hypothetical protein
VNPITNLNPVYSHSYTWQYIITIIIIPELLSLTSIYDADIFKAIKRLNFSKCVEIDHIPGVFIKGRSGIFIPILSHIYYLSVTQQYFSAGWKEAALIPIFKRGNHAAVSNYRPIPILSNFSKLFEFIVRDYVLHYLKFNRNQHGFTKYKFTVTKFITFVVFMTPVVHGQRQADALYFRFFTCFWPRPPQYALTKIKLIWILWCLR